MAPCDEHRHCLFDCNNRLISLKLATGRPCIPALPSSWKMQAHSDRLFEDYAAVSNKRCVSDQLGRKRIHFHVNRRLNAGVELELLEQLTFFKRKHCFRRCRHTQSMRKNADKTETNARKRWHGARNAGTKGRPVASFRILG